MFIASSFEQNALLCGLEEDSLVTVLAGASGDWNIDQAEAIKRLALLVQRGLLAVFKRDTLTDKDDPVPVEEFGKVVRLKDYGVRLAKTETTLQALSMVSSAPQ